MVHDCPFLECTLPGVERPTLIRVSGDQLNRALYAHGDFLLLERGAELRRRPPPGEVFAIDYGDYGAVRRVRVAPDQVLCYPAGGAPRQEDYISLRGRSILDIIKARVIWIGRSTPQSTE
jgi:hypothetical protein